MHEDAYLTESSLDSTIFIAFRLKATKLPTQQANSLQTLLFDIEERLSSNSNLNVLESHAAYDIHFGTFGSNRTVFCFQRVLILTVLLKTEL